MMDRGRAMTSTEARHKLVITDIPRGINALQAIYIYFYIYL